MVVVPVGAMTVDTGTVLMFAGATGMSRAIKGLAAANEAMLRTAMALKSILIDVERIKRV